MLVYITRPHNHEVVMGGWRHVVVWTEKPHFYHWPRKGHPPSKDDEDKRAVYYDREWATNGDRKLYCRFKPLAEQNETLANNAWQLVVWSCIPKSANIALKDTFAWCDMLLPGETREDEFHQTNYDTLLWHIGNDSDLASNVHFKRFLLEANLVTGECQIVAPTVHFFDGYRTIETQDIEEPYASRRNYACPEMDDDIPF